MDAAALIKAIYSDRERWIEIDPEHPEKVLCVRRPDETGMQSFRSGATADDFIAQVVNWREITEADLRGAEIGASDMVPWNAELFAVVARDRVDWLKLVMEAVLELIREHLAKKERASGN